MIRFLFLISAFAMLTLSPMLSNGQDTLKVMSYNLLNFPDGRNDCGSNLVVPSRWDTLRKIVQFYQPDILMVCELQNQEGADSILSASLNVGGINYYAAANFVVNQSGYTGLNNMFFYNTQKVTLHSQSEILTDLRDIGEYVVYANDPNLSVYNDTTFIHFYVSHLKAGKFNAPVEENRRNLECGALRTYVDGITSTGNFIFGGDFNFYTSSEPGYQTLITGGVNKFNDPINRPGNWNNNSSFADVHTQSTRSSQNIECGAPGGMDDRFDFILISDSIVNGGDRVQYMSGTYAAFGNDGNHFNQSINNLPNTAAPDSVINALYYMSDHLPVVMDLLITFPNVMLLTTAPTEINCNGNCDGIATATVAGGSLPYTYQWDDPGLQTTLVATGLCAGTFRFTFTDNTGLTLVDSVVLTDPALLVASFSDSSIISCSGDSSGFATVNAVGGTAPFTYLWNDPAAQTTATATGLTAGSYTVTVTDNRSCSDAASITITQVTSAPLSVSISDTTNILCNGLSTGATAVSTSGGTLPYTFLWNDANAQTDSIATGLVAGTYYVVVTDSVGCPGSDTVIITQTAALTLAISDTATASCGSTDTYAAVSVSGGLGTYTYLWDDPLAQTTDTASSVASGVYTVIVTDSVGCVDSAQANVIDFSGPTISITDSNHVNCFGSANGSATVTPSGGTAPYTYLWSPSGSTDSTASFLTAGVHTVIVVDNAPCSTVVSVTITEPPVFTATLTDSVDVLCFGDSTGTATVTPIGGTLPYTYTWSNGDTDSIADSLTAGPYTIAVVDGNGCVANGGAALTNCFEIRSILVDACNPSGPESDNEMVRFEVGSADLNTAGLVVDWPNNNWDGLCQNATTSDIIDSINANILSGGMVVEPTGGVLPAGAQVMLITSDQFDWQSHNWSALDYTLYLIFQCDGNFSGHFKNGDCACGSCASNRTLSLSFGGGCADTVSYVPCDLDAISGGSNGDEVEYDDAGNPTYQNIGCAPPIVLASPPMGVTISQPASAVAASILSSGNSGCVGDSTGSANADGSGGLAPYTYLWDDVNAQTDSAATGLPAGNYVATVTDNNGCVDTAQITITEPSAAVAASITGSINIVCFGASTGSATASAAGGTSPYAYTWDDPGSQTNATATLLASGSYMVLVTDANGCLDSATVTLTEPPLFTIFTVDLIDAHCGQSDGIATVNSIGGTLPHTYLWDDPSAQTDTVANGLSAGTYKVVFTDALGCSDSLTLVINDLPGPGIADTASTSVICNGDSTGTASVAGGGGSPPYTYLWDDVNAQTDSLATGLPAGTYEVIVSDNFGCQDSVSITVGQITILTASITDSGSTNCNGDSTGYATVTPSGGTGSYTYLWDDINAQTDSTANGLPFGAYSVIVTDSNGCQTTVNTSVAQPSVLSLSTTSTPANCGLLDGTTTVNASGATGPYTYAWNTSPVQTDSTATGLGFGTYTVVVVDSLGCLDSTTAGVSNPGGPTVAITDSTNVSCNGDSTGTATITPSGGTAPYIYLWNTVPAQTDSIATGLPAGSYNVDVTDAVGCGTVGTVTIAQPAALVLAITNTPAACGDSSGTATASVVGGIAPYNYAWNNLSSQTDSTATGLYVGTFTVTVTDDSGCVAIDSTLIAGSGAFTISTGVTDVLCSGDSSGTATATAVGGTSPFTYLWNDPNLQTTASATGLPAGPFAVVVTDAAGCTDIGSITVNEPLPIAGTVTITNVSCGGTCDGSGLVSISGGTAPYSYTWNTTPVQSDSLATGLCPGTYSVNVEDNSGCTTLDSMTITSPDTLTLEVIGTDASCVGTFDGSVTANFSGGVGPYTFLWSDITCSTAGAVCNNVGAGSYSLTLTDANGCTALGTDSVGEPVALSATLTSTPSLCIDSLGTATAVPDGGTPPYVYIWDDPNAQTTTIAIGLDIGTYNVTIADLSGCSIVESVTVTGISGPVISNILVTNESCPGAGDGSAVAIFSGGLAPYSFLWTDENFAFLSIAPSVANLSAGTYYVGMLDAQNCPAVDSTIVQTDPDCFSIPSSFTPNGDIINDTWIIKGIQKYPDNTVEIYNRWGSLLYSSDGYAEPWDGTYEGSDVAAATYYYIIVLDDNQDPFTGSITVVR